MKPTLSGLEESGVACGSEESDETDEELEKSLFWCVIGSLKFPIKSCDKSIFRCLTELNLKSINDEENDGKVFEQ